MRFLTDLTLGKRITLLTTAGLVLGVGVFGFLGMRAVNQATEAMLQDRLTTARLVADYLDEALGRALNQLENTARVIQSNGATNSPEPQIEALEATYSRFSFHPHSFYLLNESGQIIWSKPESGQVEGVDISFYPSIGQAVREGEVSISGLVLSPVTGEPVILLAAPTHQDHQEGRSTLVVAIDIARSSIGGFIRPIRLGETGYVEVIDQNGVVVSRTDPGPELAPFERSDHSGRFAALIAAGEPTRGLCHTCHEPIQKVERKDVLAFVPLSKAHWGVVIRQSEEEALAPIRDLRHNLLLSGLGLVTMAFLFVALTTRDVVSRIRMLTAASQRIATGDLISPVASSRKDEIGILAQVLNDMRAKLKASYEELEQRTKELSSLLSVSEILNSLPDLSNLDTALGSALDKTLEIMKANTGGILLLDEEKQMLYYQVYRGLSKKQVREASAQPGKGIAGRVAQTGESIVMEDILTDPRADQFGLIAGEGIRGFASVPLRSKEKVMGVIDIAFHEPWKFSAKDVQLLESIAAQIAIAIENAKLHQEVQRKEEIRGELLQDILSIQEEERRRIARELHDETSQVLASLTASLEAATGMLPANENKAKAILRKAQALSINILDDIHKLIYELRPTLLDDMGLVAAVRGLVDNYLGTAGITVNFKTTGRVRRLVPQLETTLFRVIQEAAHNIAKHAQAHNANVSLHYKRGGIRVRVRDDGRGFDVEEAISSKNRPRGLGLLGMKERIELVSGTLSIRSRPDSGGTEIDIEIPTKEEVSNG